MKAKTTGSIVWRLWRCNQPLSILNLSVAAPLVSVIHLRARFITGVAYLIDLRPTAL